MKTKFVKIFLFAVSISIFLFLFTKEVNAGCEPFWSNPYDGCPGYSSCAELPCWKGEYYGNAQCYYCVGEILVHACCTSCSACGGGGGGDTTPPVCGVEIEPSVTGGNLVKNNSFDSWTGDSLNDWTWGLHPPKKLDGPFWDRLHNPRSSPSVEVYDYIQQDIPVQKGAIYFVQVWAKARYYEQEGDKNWGVARFSVDDSYGIVVVEGTSWPWTKFEGTFVAKDRTMTLQLIADWAGDNSWYTEVAFDDIIVQKIEGADSTPDKDVQLKIGVWDDRSINEYRIRNQGQAWEKDADGEAIWQETVRTGNRGFEFFNQSFPWTLSNSYGVEVELRDAYANKSETCSDTITFSAPDLIVSGFQIRTSGCGSLLSGCAQPGESLCARITVKNIGNARAPGSFIGFRKRGGLEPDTKWISFLDPGLTHTKNFDFTAPDTPVPYTAKAWADYTNIVDESDETNNTANASYCVATPIMSAWFQTQEGDVHAQGNISVSVPAGENFCLNGSGGTPGVVSHSGSADFSPGSVSSTGWQANTSFSGRGFNYFYQLLGSPEENLTSGNLSAIGDEVVYYTGDGKNIDITNGNFPAGKKAVILVNGNVNIANDIIVPEGSFLAIIASGKIDIANSVSRIEGVFIADLAFDAGTATTALIGEGTFVANSFDLDGRDLGALNESTPAIKFIYRSDLWLNAPDELLIPSYTWQELAP